MQHCLNSSRYHGINSTHTQKKKEKSVMGNKVLYIVSKSVLPPLTPHVICRVGLEQ